MIYVQGTIASLREDSIFPCSTIKEARSLAQRMVKDGGWDIISIRQVPNDGSFDGSTWTPKRGWVRR